MHAVEQAKEIAQQEEYVNDRVLVIFLPDCHESLAGIVAGRIREAYYRPTLVVTRSEHGAKGSGRSIESYSMYEELCKCEEYLTQFGGHPMAAGFSLKEADIDAFRRKLNEVCTLTEEELRPKVVIDVPMPISYITERLVNQLGCLEPFGKGKRKTGICRPESGDRAPAHLRKRRPGISDESQKCGRCVHGCGVLWRCGRSVVTTGGKIMVK